MRRHRVLCAAVTLPVATSKAANKVVVGAQGYLKFPNGRALTGHSHNYKRNGTLVRLCRVFRLSRYGRPSGA